MSIRKYFQRTHDAHAHPCAHLRWAHAQLRKCVSQARAGSTRGLCQVARLGDGVYLSHKVLQVRHAHAELARSLHRIVK